VFSGGAKPPFYILATGEGRGGERRKGGEGSLFRLMPAWLGWGF